MLRKRSKNTLCLHEEQFLKAKARGKGTRKGKQAKAKAKSKSEARLQEEEAKPLRARKLKKHTSAEEWIFGKGSENKDSEQKVFLNVNQIEKKIREEITFFSRLPPTAAMPLTWWRQHSVQLPYLGSLAAVVLGVPASTASLERLFSDAGRAITRRRPRLQPRNAAGLIFGHANLKFGVTGRLAASEKP